jgi:hypothetical protein
MGDDPMSWVDAEMSRLKGLLRVTERERDQERERVSELEAQKETLQARSDELQFCLDQARIALDHFSNILPDFEHRKLAHGAMVGSDMNLTDERVAVRKHLATHPLPGMTCPECPAQGPVGEGARDE